MQLPALLPKKPPVKKNEHAKYPRFNYSIKMGRNDRGTFYEMKELTSPSYEPLVRITRCLHFDDVLENYQKNALVSQPIGNTKNYSIKRLKVLWFAPTKKSFDESNFYGNVSYVINWKDVLKKFGPYMYAIDQSTLAFKSFSRILLTDVRHPELTELDDEYLVHKNSPLKFDYFEYSHVNRCRCTKQFGDHELQIGIEETTLNQAGKWLFANCQEIANDHTDINIPDLNSNRKFESHKCYKFNTIQRKECLYKFSRLQSDMLVTKHKEKSRLSVAKTSIENNPLQNKTKPSFDSSSESSSLRSTVYSSAQNYSTGTVTVLPRTVAASPPSVLPRAVALSPSVQPRSIASPLTVQQRTVSAASTVLPRTVTSLPSVQQRTVAASSTVLPRTVTSLPSVQQRKVASSSTALPKTVVSPSVPPKTVADSTYNLDSSFFSNPTNIYSTNHSTFYSHSNPTEKTISYNAIRNYVSSIKNSFSGLKLENEVREIPSNNSHSSEIPQQKDSSYVYTSSQLSNALRTTCIPKDLRHQDISSSISIDEEFDDISVLSLTISSGHVSPYQNDISLSNGRLTAYLTSERSFTEASFDGDILKVLKSPISSGTLNAEFSKRLVYLPGDLITIIISAGKFSVETPSGERAVNVRSGKLSMKVSSASKESILNPQCHILKLISGNILLRYD